MSSALFLKESLGAFVFCFKFCLFEMQFPMQYTTRMIMNMCILCNVVMRWRAELVLSIAQQGMNERLAGASAGAKFGNVSVFWLDPSP